MDNILEQLKTGWDSEANNFGAFFIRVGQGFSSWKTPRYNISNHLLNINEDVQKSLNGILYETGRATRITYNHAKANATHAVMWTVIAFTMRESTWMKLNTFLAFGAALIATPTAIHYELEKVSQEIGNSTMLAQVKSKTLKAKWNLDPVKKAHNFTSQVRFYANKSQISLGMVALGCVLSRAAFIPKDVQSVLWLTCGTAAGLSYGNYWGSAIS